MMSMQQNQFYPILESLVSDWREAIPCSKQQFEACEAAWSRLVEECWDEQALVILKNLLTYANMQVDCWDWLAAELYFEAYAFALDNRGQAAVHYLQFGAAVTDEALDRYNQRMQRASV